MRAGCYASMRLCSGHNHLLGSTQGRSATLGHADMHLLPISLPLPRLAAGAICVGPGPASGKPLAPLSELSLEGESEPLMCQSLLFDSSCLA